jgi:acetyltransferase-like isoleucine patch superfamily enzyme
MMTIKFDNQFPSWNWIRQTPNSKGVWKDAIFIINDDTVKECDYYVVLGGLNKPSSVKVKYATIFIALENQDIQIYDQDFLDQFDIILTHRRDIKHKQVINSVFPAYWFVGRKQNNEVTINWSKGYDELTQLDSSLAKTKLISVIASNKRMIEGHHKRLFFVEKLKEHFGNKIDVFGRGINEVDDKWNAIAPYKYHVVLENSFFIDEVSEKIHDAFLGQAYPFYCGASNVYDYFPKNSLTCLDINNPEKAIQIIEDCIKADTFENSIEVVKQAKQLTLNYYNLFDYLYRHTTTITEKTKSKQKKVTIQPELFVINNRNKVVPTFKQNIKRKFISILKTLPFVLPFFKKISTKIVHLGSQQLITKLSQEFNEAIITEICKNIYTINDEQRKIFRSKHIEVLYNTSVSCDSEIGKYTYIGGNVGISKTQIGNYCSIANNVSIGNGEHLLDNISTSSLFYENPYEILTKDDCLIGHDVWIGADSIIRRGVKIGNGAVIGANSFVNKDVPDFAIVVGNPAKIIRYRFSPNKIQQIISSKWWEYDIEEAKNIIDKLSKISND